MVTSQGEMLMTDLQGCRDIAGGCSGGYCMVKWQGQMLLVGMSWGELLIVDVRRCHRGRVWGEASQMDMAAGGGEEGANGERHRVVLQIYLHIFCVSHLKIHQQQNSVNTLFS